MGLMDVLQPFAKGYLGARVDQMDAKAQAQKEIQLYRTPYYNSHYNSHYNYPDWHHQRHWGPKYNKEQNQIVNVKMEQPRGTNKPK